MKRVVFFSVLMILSLTAAARNSYAGVVADTSVIPGRPLAERLEGGTKTGVKKERTDVGAVNAEKTTAVKKSPAAKASTASKVPVAKTTTSKEVNTGTESNEKKANITSKAPAARKTTSSKEINTGTESNEKTATGASKTSTNTTTAKKPSTVTSKTNISSKSTIVKASTSKTSTKTVTAKKTSSKSKPKTRKLHKGIGIELFTPLAFKYAILLDVPVEKIEDDKLLEVLDHWYGTRYRYGGETRKGIDCSAFTQAFMQGYFDYDLPRTADEQYQKSKRIKKKKLRQGDLVFFKTRGAKGSISHVGVYLLNDRFVHSATSTGVRISKLNDDYYKEKYAGAGRIR